MCDACVGLTPLTTPARRHRIWEIGSGSHCLIVGTCLTLADLRALSRKLNLSVREGFPADYQLHGFFAQNAENGEKAAKMLNKLLDRRHAAAIRKARTMKCEVELAEYWSEAKEAGDIPGPYWAILSHPAVSRELSERMFADVHMLSHLVGASNRADIRRLARFEEQVAALEDQLSKQQRRHHQRIAERDRTIAALQTERRLAAETSGAAKNLAEPQRTEIAPAAAPQEEPEVERLEAQARQAATTIDEQQNRIDALAETVRSLRDENRSLELALLREVPAEETACPFDLGGHQNTVPHLRSLVESWNGRFLYHDGGKERSIDELAGAVVKADAVVFPTDCVSHSAALKVKRPCQQTMKPYVPLRSSGVASFVAGLRVGLDAVGFTPDSAAING